MEPTPQRQPLSFFSIPSEAPRPDMDIASITFPCNLFFYGSLQDDEALGYAANLERKPTLRPSTISKWKQKSWSRLPTLVPSDDPTGADEPVKGVAWECTSVQQLLDIQRLESRMYNLSPCSITLDTGEALANGYTFVWAYDPDDESLQDSAFDLETWRRNHKHAWIMNRWDEEGRLKRPELGVHFGRGVLEDGDAED